MLERQSLHVGIGRHKDGRFLAFVHKFPRVIISGVIEERICGWRALLRHTVLADIAPRSEYERVLSTETYYTVSESALSTQFINIGVTM